MKDNVVIVESPAKAKTIEKFLGNKFTVVSSFGHIRDLEKKNFGIDIENNYKPSYIISEDKKKIVAELKKNTKTAKIVWLASDEDREGEAIAWHLAEVLKLKTENTRRIVFHEITKSAILNAIKNPRDINSDLVNAQQARRVLDRLVGFELSPILWKKIKPSLSAGRVQSVAVRLLVEREREIIAFKSSSSYKVNAIFKTKDKDFEIKAELGTKFKSKKEAKEFLNKCIDANFTVSDIVTKPGKKSPSAPFTTSTLQQEASRKLGFSVSKTMLIAQKLYEAGKITYMRTDSVNLSESALTAAQNFIENQFGKKYHNLRKFKTSSKSAQEAHEAIRPTYLEKESISGNSSEQKLYELIWKRTIASQMSDAKLEKTTAKINISKTSEIFTAVGEVIKFDGFLKVYMESTDDEENGIASGLLPPIKINDQLFSKIISATEKFTKHPPRYTEASLVKKLEELGIGRPSTYAPTISTIQGRGYVIKEDRQGKERKYTQLSLINNQINDKTKSEIIGAEKSKLFPNDIGMVVNDFLVEHFKTVMDYNFTASVEKQFDDIANGNINWSKMIDTFYKPFHERVITTEEKSERNTGERLLGTDPVSGKPVYVRIGKYGPMAQIGDASEKDASDEEKPKFASLFKGQLIETITLEEALELFKFPREIGTYESKKVVIGIGRFGPYVRHDSKFYSLTKTDDPINISLERAIELIEIKREKERNKFINVFEEADLQVLNGRWGPYISYKDKNYKIPKNIDAKSLSLKDCLELVKEQSKPKKSKGKKKK